MIFSLIGGTVIGQTANTNRLTREERKALRVEESNARMEEVKGLLQDTVFLIQADRFSAQGALFGSQWPIFSDFGKHQTGSALVDPQLYFILIEKDQVLVQTGLSNERELNRVAAVTLKGQIKSWQVKPDKNGKATRIRADFSSSLGFYKLDIRITSSGIALATVEALATTGSMEYKGDVVNPEKAKYFIGGPIY